MNELPLLRSDYHPAIHAFNIRRPGIQSGETYYFETDSGLEYQVTFGRKKDNYLGNLVNFSIISDDYEDEYSETNEGEPFRVISTMIEIIRIYHEQHPFSNSYEFSGEFKKKKDNEPISIRTRLYIRAAKQVVDFRFWEMIHDGNKVILKRLSQNA